MPNTIFFACSLSAPRLNYLGLGGADCLLCLPHERAIDKRSVGAGPKRRGEHVLGVVPEGPSIIAGKVSLVLVRVSGTASGIVLVGFVGGSVVDGAGAGRRQQVGVVTHSLGSQLVNLTAVIAATTSNFIVYQVPAFLIKLTL